MTTFTCGTRLFLAFATACAIGGCAEQEHDLVAQGGDTTVYDRTSGSYSFPATNLLGDDLQTHLSGDVSFEAVFVTAPAVVNPGLGPQYNHTSCVGCHPRDGRGQPVMGQGPLRTQLLLRVSLASGTPEVPGGAVPVPGLGTQVQDQSVFGVVPEATIALSWIEEPGAYADGTPYSLRSPQVTLTMPDGAPAPQGMLTSLRLPPAVFGLGLLEAIPDEALRAHADPDDADNDGISGRVNEVWDPVTQTQVIGRFGRKASTGSLLVQTAAAYRNDMGITSHLFPDGALPPELSEETVALTAFYTQTLAVPARVHPLSASAERGEELFRSFGCASCHTPTWHTGFQPISALSQQTFHPYTDLLLHDMGPGLADGRPDFLASGTEWRTPALWGLGLVPTVLPGGAYLHDGRARTVAEAVLWHGGESQASRDLFHAADGAERQALLDFLASL